MGGVFGGLLRIYSFLGGCLIYLLIGRRAWTDSVGAYWWRLSIGSLSIGILVGIFTSMNVFAASSLSIVFGVLLRGLHEGLSSSCTKT